MHAQQPWYREPWPWLLMAGPAAVVVAGIVTAVLAVTSFDGMVADDYYKQGLGINRLLARDAKAKALGVAAELAFSPDRGRVVVAVGDATRAPTLRLALAHPTRPAEDQSILLARDATGAYVGALRAPPRGTMRVTLEDPAGQWRLAAEWPTAQDMLRLAPR